MQKVKYALITGVSSGIGLATAESLVKEGFFVFGSVRKLDSIDSKLGNILKEGDNFFPLVCDITDQKAVQASFEIVKEKVGVDGLSLLVNNAGISYYGPIQHIPIEKIREQFEVNVFSTIKFTQMFLPLLGASHETENKGKVMVISSTAGVMTRPFFGSYSGTKHAVEAIFDALRRELMLYGIDVVIIQPGPIKTNIWEKAKKMENDYQKTDYGKMLSQVDTAIADIEKIALAPEKVADTIIKAYKSNKPKARYIVTPKKLQFILAMYVFPARVLDRIFYKQMIKKYI